MRKHLKCDDQTKYTKMKRSESAGCELKACAAVHFCWNAFASRTAEFSVCRYVFPTLQGLEIQFAVSKASCKQSGTASHRLCQGEDGFFCIQRIKHKSDIIY